MDDTTAAPAAETTTAAPAAEAPVKAPEQQLRNSHWCTHPVHGVGMIGEINAQVSFHRFRLHSGDTAPSLDSEPVKCEVSDLTLCTPEQLPEYLGYTDQQLKDLGYAR